jgi:hypothetical protein
MIGLRLSDFLGRRFAWCSWGQRLRQPPENGQDEPDRVLDAARPYLDQLFRALDEHVDPLP